MTTRRAFLSGLAALVAAPAVIRTPGLLMPVRSIVLGPVTREFISGWRFTGAYRIATVYRTIERPGQRFGDTQRFERTFIERLALQPVTVR